MYINGVEYEEKDIPLQPLWNAMLEVEGAWKDGWRLSDRSEHFPDVFHNMMRLCLVRPVTAIVEDVPVTEEAPIVAKEKTEAQLLRESFAEQAGAAIVEEATKAPRQYTKKGK